MFYNELDMLEDRLTYLDAHVDHFVIVESNRSFNDKSKDLFFELNKERYKKYLHKITYLPLLYNNANAHNDAFRFEFAQRDYIVNALEQFSDDDLVYLSCLDEIPNPAKFKEAANIIKNDASAVVRFEQKMYYYNLTVRQENIWLRAYLTTKKNIVTQNPTWLSINDTNVVFHIIDNVRPDGEYPKINFYHINDAGWHLSYFMTVDQIINKLENAGHQEYNTEFFKNKERIKKCIDNAIDLFERDGGCKCIFVNPEEEFPTDFLSVFNRWKV